MLHTADDIRKGLLQSIYQPMDPDGTLDETQPAIDARLHVDHAMNRYVAKNNSSKWYRTIDKVHFDRIAQPKRSISRYEGRELQFYLRARRSYPHHNLY